MKTFQSVVIIKWAALLLVSFIGAGFMLAILYVLFLFALGSAMDRYDHPYTDAQMRERLIEANEKYNNTPVTDLTQGD